MILLNKLKKIYNKHGQIVIGVDFDDTIFNYSNTPEVQEQCNETIKTLKEVQLYAIFCLWTVADEYSLIYKKAIADTLLELPFDYINESPLDIVKTKKPFFNLLLDDTTHLSGTLEILKQFTIWAKEQDKYERKSEKKTS